MSESMEVSNFFRQNLIRLGIGLAVFFMLLAALSFVFGPQIEEGTLWIYTQFGFVGLAFWIYVGDALISPLPPDLVLIVISSTEMRLNWQFYVLSLSLISVAAGTTGWFIGRYLSFGKWRSPYLEKAKKDYGKKIEKYGVWTVVIGAVTPFPFSVTCWLAGYLRIPFGLFFLAALTRVPRFFLYYLVIKLGLSFDSISIF